MYISGAATDYAMQRKSLYGSARHLLGRKLDDAESTHFFMQTADDVLSDEIGRPDDFCTLNCYYQWRIGSNVADYRANYIDLDCYALGMTAETCLAGLEATEFGRALPFPSIVLYSGRGLLLIWLYEDPVSYKNGEAWRCIQRCLHIMLRKYGSDAKALDAAHVFRLPGSVNSKCGSTVHIADYGIRYTLAGLLARLDLTTQIVDSNPAPDAMPRRPKSKRAFTPSKNSNSEETKAHKNTQPIYNPYTLQLAVIEDLFTLTKIRGKAIEGCREVILFWTYQYARAAYRDDDKAVAVVLQLYSRMASRIKEREVLRVSVQRNSKQYRAKTETLINQLGITLDEQKQLKVLISPAEKARRKRVANGWHEEGQQQRTADIAASVLKLTEDGKTNAQIAEALGISVRTVQRYRHQQQKAAQKAAV